MVVYVCLKFSWGPGGGVPGMGTPPCLFLAPGGSGGCPCPWLVGTSLQSLPLPSSLCVCSDFPLVRTPPIPLVGPAPILQTPSCFDLPRQRPRLQIGSHSRVRGGRETLGGPYSTYSGLPERLRGKESACQAGNMGWIPGSGRCPRGGDGSLLQCSCLGNPLDRGAWRAAVRGVAKRQTRLSDSRTTNNKFYPQALHFLSKTWFLLLLLFP